MGTAGSKKKGGASTPRKTETATRSTRAQTLPVLSTPPPEQTKTFADEKASTIESPKRDFTKKRATESDLGNAHKRTEEFFLQYKDEENAIGPGGMEKLCKDLGVPPEDISMLVLAYHLEAKDMGYFTKEEFCKGMQKLNCDGIGKLKSSLNNFREELKNPPIFKEIYKFAFVFAKETDKKLLEIPTAAAMLSLLLDQNPHTKPFVEFLQEQKSYKALNMDQWNNFLDFSLTVAEDFSNYDENAAWPVMFDEYALWSKAKRAQ